MSERLVEVSALGTHTHTHTHTTQSMRARTQATLPTSARATYMSVAQSWPWTYRRTNSERSTRHNTQPYICHHSCCVRTHGAEKTTTSERTTHPLNKSGAAIPPLVAPHVDAERVADLANANTSAWSKPWRCTSAQGSGCTAHTSILIRRRWRTRCGPCRRRRLRRRRWRRRRRFARDGIDLT